MSREGIWGGVGDALTEIAGQIRQNQMQSRQDRDKEADRLEKTMDAIAMNRAMAKQELGMIAKDTPDYISKQGELQNLEQQLNSANQAYQGLFNGDTPGMIQRLKFWHGRKAQQPAVTAEMRTAAARRPDFKESDAYFTHRAGLERTEGIKTAKEMDDLAQTQKTAHDNAIIEAATKRGMDEQQLTNLKDLLAGIPYQLLIRENAPRKPVEAKFHPTTGGLYEIADPNTGTSYTAANIDKAPPEIKQQWETLQKQTQDELDRKAAAEAAKVAEAEKRDAARFERQLTMQTNAIQAALDAKDYGEARKLVGEGEDLYQSAVDRQRNMDTNLKKAKKGDQQAMLALVADHIGMTLGAQKGARINQAVWNEAIASTPWLDKLAAKFDERGFLSGVTLATEQMDSMVNLAHEKVGNLKQHVDDVKTRYRDVLALNKNPGKLKEDAKPKTSLDDEIMSAVGGAKSAKTPAKKK